MGAACVESRWVGALYLLALVTCTLVGGARGVAPHLPGSRGAPAWQCLEQCGRLGRMPPAVISTAWARRPDGPVLACWSIAASPQTGCTAGCSPLALHPAARPPTHPFNNNRTVSW